MINFTCSIPILWVLCGCLGDSFLETVFTRGSSNTMRKAKSCGRVKKMLKRYAMHDAFLAFAKVWLQKMSQVACWELKCKASWDSFHAVMIEMEDGYDSFAPTDLKLSQNRICTSWSEKRDISRSLSERYGNVDLMKKYASFSLTVSQG